MRLIITNLLKEKYLPHAYRIDGDEMRELFKNKDYSMKGRIANIDAAQKIAHYLHNQGKDVIVSLVSPYLDQREEFKALLGDELVEFYIHTSEERGREQYHVKGYQPPLDNFVNIDTTYDTVEESFKKVVNYVKEV